MGIIVKSLKSSVEFTYDGFNRLKEIIATCINEEVGLLYADLKSAPWFENGREAWYKSYDKRLQDTLTKYPEYAKVISFLYKADQEGRADLATVRQLYAILEHCDNDESLGPDEMATVRGFRQILMECVDTKSALEWF